MNDELIQGLVDKSITALKKPNAKTYTLEEAKSLLGIKDPTSKGAFEMEFEEHVEFTGFGQGSSTMAEFQSICAYADRRINILKETLLMAKRELDEAYGNICHNTIYVAKTPNRPDFIITCGECAQCKIAYALKLINAKPNFEVD